ncbi:hypothetical protein [Sphingomonas bacterium]|uniref:hypothetical protein n=1 Tax=Sphingomonas bacterium TaxID=1895847 RepID=UPI0026043BB4|nr:hypothetical protein [Sphingomonas bacterium]
MDPSPWLLLTVPFLAVAAYVSYRGWARGQFRVPGRGGWAHYHNGSLDWYGATLLNLVFLGAGVFMLYQSVFRGSDFSREPVLPMPVLTGEPIETVKIKGDPGSLARCLATKNHGQLFALGQGSWRVVVRNGRNRVMYTFDIVPRGGASRMDIYRSWPSPFVGWDGCLAGTVK